MSDFHLLIEEQIPRLMRYAAALTRDPDEAGELVEDTVREALANQRRSGAASDFRVRLLTILHDLRGNPFRTTVAAPGGLDRDPAALLTLSDLDRALGQLAEDQRAIILLVGLESLPYSQVAAILRITAGTLKSRLARARDRLRRAMGVDAAEPRVARAA
ncbi:MAG TPA: sigma factor-like helix-turn-helix DNA-binding protein [Stellaceae bacterium]|nr:sigma factor-like helix-turn-helix DNA-binding protein [Stellaceae bacterium]